MTESDVDKLRPLLFSIAYRMLASVADADDIVQEALLRYHRAVEDGAAIESPKAYLSAIVTRLSIDQLRSARQRREVYVGEWLPEPLLTDDNDPARTVEQHESISMAFLLLLERLSPIERAVFLLHDVFGYAFDEIAEIVRRTPAYCRQLSVRARRHIETEKPRFETSKRVRDELAARFFSAVTSGDMDGLLSMLAEDAVAYGDGGGKVPAVTRPVVGRTSITQLLLGFARLFAGVHVVIEPREVNGQSGAVLRDSEGRLINVMVLDIADGVIRAVRSVVNPEKLDHLGEVADVRAILKSKV